MSKKNPGRIDCACVIHGSGYDWSYVERLYNMLCRNLHAEVRLHVYTEHDRSVPPHMVKHILTDWGIAGPSAVGGTKCSCSILNILPAISCTLI